jgi:hypothetical protein
MRIIILACFLLQGCGAAGYVASAAGVGHTEYKYNKLEDRVKQLETILANPPDGDIWE